MFNRQQEGMHKESISLMLSEKTHTHTHIRGRIFLNRTVQIGTSLLKHISISAQ